MKEVLNRSEIIDYKQVEKIMDSYNLKKEEKPFGTDFQLAIGNKHRIVLERLKPLINGEARGFLYVRVLDDYMKTCSKNGHINVKNISSEAELRSIVERVIRYFEKETS